MGKTIPLSLSGFCSHLVTSLHVIVTKLCRPRHPGWMLARMPQDCFCEGEPLLPGSLWKHTPPLRLGLGDLTLAPTLPWCIHRALRQSQPSVGLLFLKTGRRLPMKVSRISTLPAGAGWVFWFWSPAFKCTRVENQVWAMLLCAYLNCCPTHGIV